MVANGPIERTGPGQLDYILNRLNDIERRLDQGSARSTFPFSVGHLGVTDFQIIQSTSGDGSADIYLGNGAGGKLIQIKTDSLYGTKIFVLSDQQGIPMMSTDALAGFGMGTPSWPFPYGGIPEEINMTGATTKGTAATIGQGINYVYNPAVYLQPRVRVRSSTAETFNIYAQFRHADGSTYNTADATYAIPAGTVALRIPEFNGQWVAGDVNHACAVFFKAYCNSGIPANVFTQLSYQSSWGLSQRAYNDSNDLK